MYAENRERNPLQLTGELTMNWSKPADFTAAEIIFEDTDVQEVTRYDREEQAVVTDDEQTDIIERKVEGKLAEDIRKRVDAPSDALVLITEVVQASWRNFTPVEDGYHLTVKCNGVIKEFKDYTDEEEEVFANLTSWLAEAF